MRDLLFDAPWWLLILLIGGGGFVWYTGNARLERSWKIAGIIIALLGVGLGITSWLFQTDKKFVESHSRLIVDDFVHRDWTGLQTLLDPRTSIEGVYKNRDAIVAGAKKTVDEIGITTAKVTGTEVKQADTVITVDMNILTEQEITMGRPVVSSWRFDWENTGTGWKLVRIEPLDNSQLSKQDVVARMQRP